MDYIALKYEKKGDWEYIKDTLSKYNITPDFMGSWNSFEYIGYGIKIGRLTNYSNGFITHQDTIFCSTATEFTYRIGMILMKKEFTKDNLKSGMVVITRNKMEALVVNDLLLFHSGFEPLSNYTDDLVISEEGCEDYDIVEVYARSNGWARGTDKPFPREELLWDRGGIKEYTMQEIADKLGIPVEQLRIKK